MKKQIFFFLCIGLMLILWILIMDYSSNDFSHPQKLQKKEIKTYDIFSEEDLSKKNYELSLSVNKKSEELKILAESLYEKLLLEEEIRSHQDFSNGNINELIRKINILEDKQKALEKRQKEYNEVLKSVYRHLLSVQDSVFTEMKRLREVP